MSGVPVCRICLNTEVKLYDINSFPLNTYVELVVGINPLNTMDLPDFICYECATLLQKYYKFHEKCVLGQSVLYGILHRNGKITLEEIKQVNREDLNLVSNRKHCRQLEDNTINLVFNESDFNNLFYEIKAEPNDVEPNDLKELKENSETVEDDFRLDDVSDDEPLSFHKEKKRKQKKKLKKSDTKKMDDFDDLKDFLTMKIKEDIDLQEESLQTELPKRKRGRPRKRENEGASEISKKRRGARSTAGVENLEEYVTIIKLSVEEQLEEISKRKETVNYQNAPFQCNLCFKGFIDNTTWNHHTAKHDPKAGDIECKICKFRFKDNRALQKHAVNHEKKFACKACPFVSKTTTQAKQHQRWHKGVIYKCKYCDEVSTKWTSHLSHVRIKHPSTHVCGACGYSFVSELGLSMHRSMMHKHIRDNPDIALEAQGPYCAECDVKFETEEAFKRHMVTSVRHTQTNGFGAGCRVCGETFKSTDEMKRHHRALHARQRPKNYGKKPDKNNWPAECEHCDEMIQNARDYWAHFRREHPDKNYPIEKNHICDICGKGFRGNAFLVYHKRTHFEERAYKCSQCSKAFHNRGNLQLHEKTHSDHRPYPCQVCFKAFKCKGALDRHFRSHTGVKPYRCEVCGKSFGQSNSRKLHVQTVHLKQPAPYVSRARKNRPAHTLAPVTPAYHTAS